jgi:hypothetical protein
MHGAGGTVDNKPLTEVIEGLRALLKAIEAGRLSRSAAYRNRLHGAVVALDERPVYGAVTVNVRMWYPRCNTAVS